MFSILEKPIEPAEPDPVPVSVHAAPASEPTRLSSPPPPSTDATRPPPSTNVSAAAPPRSCSNPENESAPSVPAPEPARIQELVESGPMSRSLPLPPITAPTFQTPPVPVAVPVPRSTTTGVVYAV
jgi:hypothetical protein